METSGSATGGGPPYGLLLAIYMHYLSIKSLFTDNGIPIDFAIVH